MRQLTKSQKKLLDKWFAANPSIYDMDSLSSEQRQTLQTINDSEILYQEVNRYLMDKKMSDNRSVRVGSYMRQW
jgi:hypothetical protein